MLHSAELGMMKQIFSLPVPLNGQIVPISCGYSETGVSVSSWVRLMRQPCGFVLHTFSHLPMQLKVWWIVITSHSAVMRVSWFRPVKFFQRATVTFLQFNEESSLMCRTIQMFGHFCPQRIQRIRILKCTKIFCDFVNFGFTHCRDDQGYGFYVARGVHTYM